MRLRSILVLLLAIGSAPAARGQGSESFAGTLPIVGSVHGNFGSNFKTTVQLTNPFGEPMTGRLVFTPMGVAARTDSIPWELGPHGTNFWGDIANSLGGGLGSLDVWFDGTPIDVCSLKPYSGGPVVSARIYNDAGDAGTTGCNEDLVTSVPGGGALALVRGVLLGPPSMGRYRFNVGLRTFEEDVGFPTVPVIITVYNPHGIVVHTLTREYPGNYFSQMDVTEFLDGFEIGDNYWIELQTLARIVVYGATVDNVTNSPTIQIMAYVDVSG